MLIAIDIRPEAPGDAPAIDAGLGAAFAGVPHSDQSEARTVRALRRDGALSLSLLAVRVGGCAGDCAGYVAASPVRLSGSPGRWFGLGPVAVDPRWQRQGVGQALVRAALADLRARGAAGVVLLGDPAYYARFGFAALGDLSLPGLPAAYADHVQALAFGDQAARGTLRYPAAFGLAPEASFAPGDAPG